MSALAWLAVIAGYEVVGMAATLVAIRGWIWRDRRGGRS